MVSGTFLVYLLDEISTGLDISATYDIVSAFCTMARIRHYTCLFSLLQPSPEVFNLFDRYVSVNETHGWELFYFVVSEGKSTTVLVVLLLNGGPGCSSFDGSIYEHGDQLQMSCVHTAIWLLSTTIYKQQNFHERT